MVFCASCRVDVRSWGERQQLCFGSFDSSPYPFDRELTASIEGSPSMVSSASFKVDVRSWGYRQQLYFNCLPRHIRK